MEEALIGMVRGRMRNDSQYPRHPSSVPRKRMLSQASEKDFEDIIRASKVTAGQFRAFIASRLYKDTSRRAHAWPRAGHSGVNGPAGGVRSQPVPRVVLPPRQSQASFVVMM